MAITSYDTKHGKRWEVRYYLPDWTTTRKRGFVRKRDAEEWAAAHVTTAKSQGSFIQQSAGNATIRDLYTQYVAEHESLWKPSMRHTVESRWRTHVEPRWATYKIKDVSRAELQAWVSELAARRSASVVRACTDILNGIFTIALKDHRISANPLQDVNLPSKPRKKATRTYLTVKQLLAFGDACLQARNMPESRRALVLTLGFCGLRWGEMCALRVSDIDIDKHRINVRTNLVKVGSQWVEGTPKTSEARSVPMPQIVADALQAIIQDKPHDARVFTDPSGEPPRLQSVSDTANNKGWYIAALRRAGLPLVSPHELRHTAASIAVQSGANVKAVQRMLGHASAVMTLDVYADLFDADLDALAHRVDTQISRVQKMSKNYVQNMSKSK